MTVPDAMLLCAAGAVLLVFAQRLRRAQPTNGGASARSEPGAAQPTPDAPAAP